MKPLLLIILIALLICPSVYAWTAYSNVRYLDLDGDFEEEIIIESKHGIGTGHYIEDMRIYKDKYPELELIFHIRTLDSYFNSIYNPGKYWDLVSEVEFTEQTPENKGIRGIIVKSKKIYYKDIDKTFDREEDLGTKVYKWNEKKFVKSKEEPDTTTQAKIITELGVVYIDMPKEYLEKAGYTKLLRKGYRREGNEEWITYLNWTTEEPDDLATFYIVDEKVKGWKEK